LEKGDNRRGYIGEGRYAVKFKERDKDFRNEVEIDGTGFFRKGTVTEGVGGEERGSLGVIGGKDGVEAVQIVFFLR
jgi:hypothetical protein